MAESPDDTRSPLGRGTFTGRGQAGALMGAKLATSQSVTVCLPALNERETVGKICRSIVVGLMQETPLVDELLVVDSGSEDDTAEVALAAGATVFEAAGILPRLGGLRGKGETLWKSL